jgi:hypothetical protein
MIIEFNKEALYYQLNDLLDAINSGDRSTAIYIVESLINDVKNS